MTPWKPWSYGTYMIYGTNQNAATFRIAFSSLSEYHPSAPGRPDGGRGFGGSRRR
jgi:hypothetical protein